MEIRIIDEIPQIYKGFLPDIFYEKRPAESIATCDNCIMVDRTDGDNEKYGLNYFSADYKCCTFTPFMPNYLIGGVFSDSSKDIDFGMKALAKRIKNKQGVTPHGVFTSKKTELLYKSGGLNVFGKSDYFICPCYNLKTRGCGIYNYRAATCSTYFCKYEKGKDGALFWEFFHSLISKVENKLIKYTLLKQNYSLLNINSVFDNYHNKRDLLQKEDIEDTYNSDYYNSIWDKWKGYEIDFYKECYEIVKKMTKEDFNEICGIDTELMIKELKMLNNNMKNPEIKEVLKRNSKLKVHKTEKGNYLVSGYFDKFIEIPSVLYNVVDLFDGYLKTEEVLKLAEEKFEVTLDEQLIVSLYHNRIVL